MRVISGLAKGHKLKCPKGLNTRPTSDRIKESLFNMIAGDIQSTKVLDLFAGAGSLGIEALSRGANYVDFVDKKPLATRIICENLISTKLIEHSTIHTSDCYIYLDKCYNIEQKYDIIFLDPPYSKGFIKPILQKINTKKILADKGFIVIEHEKNDVLSDMNTEFDVVRFKNYGRTCITIVKYKKNIS